MKEYLYENFRILAQTPIGNTDVSHFDEAAAERALRFHRSLPDYRRTDLVKLACAAERYGVDSIFVKDESSRFGLKAFKGLGGSYCMFRILCEKLGLDADVADYSSFSDDRIRKACSSITFATATDGNHGKGVSWAAKIFGCRAHVFMPKGTVEARRRAVEAAGSATAVITEMNYDETVRYASRLAEQNGWVLIQDTAWDGYEKIPGWIIEGYLTMAAEAEAQMGAKKPTHIFLQAGVGSMAGGVAAYFVHRAADQMPHITIVEAEGSDCIYQSAKKKDGQIHTVSDECHTIMAGLNCGTPCKTVWPILRDCSGFYCACKDCITEAGMRAYASPLAGEISTVVSGESGAVTYGLLLEILQSQELRQLFRIDSNSVILLFNTEGDTDPEDYARVIAEKPATDI